MRSVAFFVGREHCAHYPRMQKSQMSIPRAVTYGSTPDDSSVADYPDIYTLYWTNILVLKTLERYGDMNSDLRISWSQKGFRTENSRHIITTNRRCPSIYENLLLLHH